MSKIQHNCNHERVTQFEYFVEMLMMDETPEETFYEYYNTLPEDDCRHAVLEHILKMRTGVDKLTKGDLSAFTSGEGYCLNLLSALQGVLKKIVSEADRVAKGNFDIDLPDAGELTTALKQMIHMLDDAFTEQAHMRISAEESEKRQRLIADHASDVIWTMNLEGRITYVSPSVERLRGYTPKEVMAQGFDELLTENSSMLLRDGLEKMKTLINQRVFGPLFRGQIEQPCKNGGTVWTEATISALYDETGAFLEILGISRDITEQKKLESEIIKISTTDKLTQVHNRLKLESILEFAFKEMAQNDQGVTLVIFDVDYFKSVNDTFGHPIGDLVLMELSQLVNTSLKPLRLAYHPLAFGRWGGEEFMIILGHDKNENREKVYQHIDYIRKKIAEYSFSVPKQITCSFGLGFYEKGMTSLELVSKADQAMYRAKDSGRNCTRM